ncbi:Putative Holin-X, holin superfamily III [Microlunatus soli]|uniref:Putative Holin-X, holin superfamily III n=2 Tax=Microlunatus soli TaxID=630515 RepID=A0A1H1N6Z5_9ACTN|nr:Putative Holin-X, holin superfamily III [Microlunatus soli]
MTDLSDQLVRLIRDELQLAKVDLADSARHAGLGIGMFGAAGILALFGLGGLIATAMIALALVAPWWLAALIISLAVLVVAGILALIGRGQALKAPPPAGQLIASMKADVDAVKEGRHHDDKPSK